MLAQTKEQKIELDRLIPELMLAKKKIIEVNMASYGDLIMEKLGLDYDGIINDMREQVWKAIITHDKSGGANLSTWLNRLIDNRFKYLIRKAYAPKYKNVQYYEDVYEMLDDNGIDSPTTTDVTSETLYEKREQFLKETSRLPEPYKQIYKDVSKGCTIMELMQMHKMNRVEVVSSLKKIETYLVTCRN